MKKIIHNPILKVVIVLLISFVIPCHITVKGSEILTYSFALTTDIALFSLALAITAIFFTVLDRYQQAVGNANPKINSLIDGSLKEMGDNTLALFFISVITFIFSIFQSVFEKINKIDVNTSLIIFSYLLTFLIIYDITKSTVILIREISIIRK